MTTQTAPLTETSAQKLARLVAMSRARNATPSIPLLNAIGKREEEINASESIGRDGNTITLNTQQLSFVNLALSGESCILIGAAGTGKTTSVRSTITHLVQSGKAGILEANGHKYLQSGTPGIVCVSYTRRAVSNLRKSMPADMTANCLTIHKLLEYSPVYYTVLDENGNEKNTMRFEATRNIVNPLSPTIHTVIIDESSMVSVELFNELRAALPHAVQYIFLGDIQQLPPVFGSAILGYKMLELKTIELTEVYRQALESPIIRLAHRILSGKPIPASEFPEWKFPNQLTIHPWKKKLDWENAVYTLAKFLTTAITNELYNPDEDMILIPFNKKCGTLELNKHLATFLARKRGVLVHEVIAGFNKHYFSIGDKVLYDKEDAVILEINANEAYSHTRPQSASLTLDYWGTDTGNNDNTTNISSTSDSDDEADIDFLLGQCATLGNENTDEERVRQASHIITVELLDSGTIVKIDTAADINSLLLSYALTVHKAQGSEFRKVFFLLHQDHATMIQRELLYTAVTRAREELYVICEPEHFTKGIINQRIKGNTLAEKAEWFKGKKDSLTDAEKGKLL